MFDDLIKILCNKIEADRGRPLHRPTLARLVAEEVKKFMAEHPEYRELEDQKES